MASEIFMSSGGTTPAGLTGEGGAGESQVHDIPSSTSSVCLTGKNCTVITAYKIWRIFLAVIKNQPTLYTIAIA
jgi:hypothetical protein